MPVKYCVEAWQFGGDEEPCEEKMTESAEFYDKELAMQWAWDRMQEGFQTRLWLR